MSVKSVYVRSAGSMCRESNDRKTDILGQYSCTSKEFNPGFMKCEYTHSPDVAAVTFRKT
jgi:hypothetical protein